MKIATTTLTVISILLLLSSCEESVNPETEYDFEELPGFWDFDFVGLELYEKESGQEVSNYLSDNYDMTDNEINDIISFFEENEFDAYSGYRFHFRTDNIYTLTGASFFVEGLWKVNKENSTLSLSPYEEYDNSSPVTLDLRKITSNTLIIAAPEDYRKIIENDTIQINGTLLLNFIKTEPF